MADRVSRTILLCEDDQHAQLVRLYMEVCGLNTREPLLLSRIAKREVHGGNVTWVLHEFPKELRACRRRHAAHANTLLIVVVDADLLMVADRRSQLHADPPPSADDPLVVLIPKRHVETWIRCAHGEYVNETDDYKGNRAPSKAEMREVAKTIHSWAHGNPPIGTTCVQSLRDALSEWRKIG